MLLADRGGLKYPSLSLLARLWTVTRFVNLVIPQLRGARDITKGLVTFLANYLIRCRDLFCTVGWSLTSLAGVAHRTKTVKLILRALVRPLVDNHTRIWTEINQRKPIVQNKPVHSNKIKKLQ